MRSLDCDIQELKKLTRDLYLIENDEFDKIKTVNR